MSRVVQVLQGVHVLDYDPFRETLERHLWQCGECSRLLAFEKFTKGKKCECGATGRRLRRIRTQTKLREILLRAAEGGGG